MIPRNTKTSVNTRIGEIFFSASSENENNYPDFKIYVTSTEPARRNQRLEQGELPPNIAELFDQFVERKDLLSEAERNILANPFKRFEDMRFLMRCKDVETIEVNPIIFRKLTREDWLHIVDVCDKSLEKYYARFQK